MLVGVLEKILENYQIAMLGVLCAWAVTLFALSRKFKFLPCDQGRAFAVNGELSKGKLRGVGLIITVSYVLVSCLFVKVSLEYAIFCILFLAIMLSGYLDDAAKTPWSDYKKGLIDLIISIMYMITFVRNNPTDVYIFNQMVHIPMALYVILGIVLIWVSINVTNCTDGVDGLCATLSMITIFSFVLLFSTELGEYSLYGLLLMGCILAYLYYNTFPSSMLMGDAGSRAFGFFIAVMAMKSGHPFSFLLLALVMIIDGGLGLVKVFLLRFFKIHILSKTRTPIHDEMRKNRGWSDTQVVIRYAIFQIVLLLVAFVLKR